MAEEIEGLTKDTSLAGSERSQEEVKRGKSCDPGKAAKKRRKAEESEDEGIGGTSITTRDVNTLIDEAQERALVTEGSDEAWRPWDSQEEKEFAMQELKGSQHSAQAGSQSFHISVRHWMKL